jgi:hypothetical protein
MLGNLLRRTRIGDRIRGALRHDAEEAMKPLRKELRRLARDVEGLQTMLQETAVRAARGDRASSQLRLMLELNERQRDRIADARVHELTRRPRGDDSGGCRRARRAVFVPVLRSAGK